MIFKLLLYIPLTYFFLLISNRLGKYFNFIDIPSPRKIHKSAVPLTGGVGIFLSMCLGVWIFYFDLMFLNFIFAGFFILLIGLLDDKYQLNPVNRLLIQIIIITYFINEFDIVITYLFEINGMLLNLGGSSLIFTTLSIMLIVHSSNYSDGIDGLLSSIVITSLSSICLMQYFLYGSADLEVLILIIPLVIFLLFNFSMRFFPKIFLGDGGSNLLGYYLACTVIYSAYFSKLNLDPLLVMWSLSYLVFEFLSTNLIRILNKRGVFEPGNDHIHYFFLKKLGNVFKVNLAIILINLSFIIIGLLFWLYSPTLSLIMFPISFFFYFYLRRRFV